MPQISIIVPVYKVEAYLHRCVDSILAQTFTDFELILVDDGSPDNCGAICDEYAAKDSRIHVIHQENGGLSAARNAGIDWAFANSDSQWLTFIDSDDWVHPQMLELLYWALADTGVHISMCYLQSTTDSELIYPEVEREVALRDPDIVYAEQYASAVVAPCKLYHKKLFKNIRYPVGKVAEDLLTSYKVLFQSPAIAVVQAPMYYYYQSTDSIMRSKWTPRKMDIIQAQENALAFFENTQFEHAKKRQLESYITNLAGHWWQISKLHNAQEYSDISADLQLKLRTALKHYRSTFRYPIKERIWIYEAAYPNIFKIYWITLAISRKIGIGRKNHEHLNCNQ